MSAMKLFTLLLLTVPHAGDATCDCLPTPNSPQQTAAPGKPAYVGQVAAYGWTCAAHDAGEDVCESDTDTGYGQANDWCLDQFCIVDPNSCDFKTRSVTYTAATDDYFSYETCDANFEGNGWVGRCKNCRGYLTSFCTCGGLSGCLCMAGATQQVAAADKPAYVGTVESYGYGCLAHDEGEDACDTGDTMDGQAHDWCLDQFCIVDPNSCDLKTRSVTYTAATDDYFSYETCDANFEGNGWVGRCTCEENSASYCTCPCEENCTSPDGESPPSDVSSSRPLGLAAVVVGLVAAGLSR